MAGITKQTAATLWANDYKLQDKEGETWKPVIGYESIYEVSNLGRVKSLERKVPCDENRFKIVKSKIMFYEESKGYLRVKLCRDNKSKKFFVHRLVLSSFGKRIEGKDFVNHINGIKTDNRFENLEWCTTSENLKHAYSIGLAETFKGINHVNHKLTDNEVLEIYQLKNQGKTQQQISDKYNISRSNISLILSGKAWAHLYNHFLRGVDKECLIYITE